MVFMFKWATGFNFDVFVQENIFASSANVNNI